MNSYYWLDTYFKLHSFVTIWMWVIYLFGSVAYWIYTSDETTTDDRPKYVKCGIFGEIVLFVIGVLLFIFLPEPNLFR